MSVKPAFVLQLNPTEIYLGGRQFVGIKTALFRTRVNTLSELQGVQMFLLARITTWIRSKIHTKCVGVVKGFARFRSFAAADCIIEMHVYACFVPFKIINRRTFII